MSQSNKYKGSGAAQAGSIQRGKSKENSNRYWLICILKWGMILTFVLLCIYHLLQCYNIIVSYTTMTDSQISVDTIVEDLFSSTPNIITIGSGLICVVLLFVEQGKYHWTGKKVIIFFTIIISYHLIRCIISLCHLPNILHSVLGFVVALVCTIISIWPTKEDKKKRHQLKHIFSKMPHNAIGGIQLYNVFVGTNNTIIKVEYMDSRLAPKCEANAISRLIYHLEDDSSTFFSTMESYNDYLNDPNETDRNFIMIALDKSIRDQSAKLNALQQNPDTITKRDSCCAYCLLIEQYLLNKLEADKDIGNTPLEEVDEQLVDRSTYSTNANYICNEEFDPDWLGIQSTDVVEKLLGSCRLNLLPVILFPEGCFYSFKHGGIRFKSERRYVAFKTNLNYHNDGQWKYESTICVVILDHIKNPYSESISNVLSTIRDRIKLNLDLKSVGDANV